MKRNLLWLACLVIALTGCRDYLTEIEPGTTLLNDFFTSTAAAEQNVTGCYVPLMWEYNNTYLSEWFIGDIVSDDALKGGGSTTDMADAYDMENWRTTSRNTLLLDFYRAQYMGIARCNLAIKYISQMEISTDSIFTPTMKDRLLGEAHFLRAYYYFRLVRVYAGVPITTDVIDDSERWGIDRSSVEQVYTLILDDLTKANSMLQLRSTMKAEDLGRATKGAAQAMLLKVNLYMASPYWNKQLTQDPATYYAAAKQWGDSIIASGEYTLCSNYEDNFSLAGENGQESVFEIQYMEVPWGDYGEGFGFTAGSYSQILMRSRSSLIGGGWGFNHPTQNLYDEFEPTDIRRDVTILNPADSLIETPSVEIYLGSRYLNNKYGMYRDPADQGGGFGKWSLHATRGPLNNRQIRYADVLLMYAEAALGAGDEATARSYINKVRTRVGLSEIALADDAALRHERRVELAMEGHRWFDLVRWEGVDGKGLKAHMDAYKATETPDAQSHMQEFVAGKHEIFPIPQEEIQLNPTQMKQNNGY
ncbi:MAG: RagB/SusD family nutrient uptake outer membrane protein [Paludibacteraceae bacterium]|nr:RagB/SusD family nutrient uptake outer membrane protein [Paludibacteraceae bacterium]